MGLYRSNDNRHSQLARTREPRQRVLDPPPHPQEKFGPAQVLAVSSDTALTDFTMGGKATGVAWSINPYLGCLHACGYCYVPETMHLERNRWGSYVAPKLNLPSILRRELKTRRKMTVFLSTGTDAYQAAERNHQITRRCLRLLLDADWPVDILTRSPLVTRDLDLLQRFGRVRVGLSIPTLDDHARRILEPNAPPIAARLRAVRRLRDVGITTYVNHAPSYPPSGGVGPALIAHELRDAGAQWVNTSEWRRVASFLGGLWDRLHRTPWRELVEFAARPALQETYRKELFASFKAAGLPARVGFYNPPFDLSLQSSAASQMKLELLGGPTVDEIAAAGSGPDRPLVLSRDASH